MTESGSGESAVTGGQPALGRGWWAGGLTLAERAALPHRPVAPPDDEEQVERARRRLARWRSGYPVPDLFVERLSADGLHEPDLLVLLAEKPGELAARAETPGWAHLAEQALAAVGDAPAIPPMPADPEATSRTGFATLVEPFTRVALTEVDAALRHGGQNGRWDAGALRAGFADELTATLVGLAARTLVLELNVLRVTKRLVGATPAERFWSYVRHFARREGLAALLAEYPVLARLLAQATRQAVDTWLELLGRFQADHSSLVDTVLGDRSPGPLVEVRFGLGDRHHGGRSVAMLRFADGSRLTYIPRPVGTQVHVHQMLDWLNSAVPDLGLRVPRLLARAGHGWGEFAEHLPCSDRDQMARFHRRQGALLALLHCLAGDLRAENLVACGEHPILVGLEAVLCPSIVQSTVADRVADDPALDALERSVARGDLLATTAGIPDPVTTRIASPARTPATTVRWTAAGTDEMRIVQAQQDPSGGRHRPRLDGAEVDSAAYAEDLLDGFRSAYEAISARRGELTGEDGLLARFAEDRARVSLRPAHTYAALLSEATHPDVLRDALDRDLLLDRLWVMSTYDEARRRVAGAEIGDLWAGDMPSFVARPGSTLLRTSGGAEVAQVLRESGLRRATDIVAGLGRADLDTQQWIIRASLAAWAPRTAAAARRAAPEEPPGLAAPDRARLLDAARTIADRLAADAHRNDGRVNWLGLALVEDPRWQVRSLSLDLYNGFPGVALFLGRLASITGEQRYADLAAAALGDVPKILDGLARLSDDDRGAFVPTGAFSGPAGLAYVLVQLRDVLDDPARDGWVERIVAMLAAAVRHDEMLDVLGGSAGCLAVMSALAQGRTASGAAQVARACAERLLERAQPEEHGVGWYTGVDALEPLSGFSNGAAGIGWALLRHAAATGDEASRDVGLQAWRYERHLHHREGKTWPDLRVLPGPGRGGEPPHAWCHGSVGVGLSRASILAHGADPEIAADLDLALDAMLGAPRAADHSLCHGELGRLELLTAAAGLGRADLRAERDRRAAVLLHEIERSGPRCGTPGAVATPGLLAGLAGIGYGLLRLAHPHRVPSVLLLDPPPATP